MTKKKKKKKKKTPTTTDEASVREPVVRSTAHPSTAHARRTAPQRNVLVRG